MDLILLVLVVCLIGLVVWALTTYIPMPQPWARIIQVFALIVVVLYVITRLVSLPNVLP